MHIDAMLHPHLTTTKRAAAAASKPRATTGSG